MYNTAVSLMFTGYNYMLNSMIIIIVNASTFYMDIINLACRSVQKHL